MSKLYYSLTTGKIIAVTNESLDLNDASFIYTDKHHSDISDYVVMDYSLVHKNSLQYLNSSMSSVEDKSSGYRSIRDKLLAESDWTQVNDNALSQERRDQWKAYRQELRDISSQPEFPNKVAWPMLPA